MRAILYMLLFVSAGTLAQTNIEKTVAIPKGNTLVMVFDYPELIKIKTWDKQEVLIKGSVSINRGENDDAFELITKNDGKETIVTSSIKDKENLPQRILIRKGDEEFYFKVKSWQDPEIQKFLDENGRQYTYMSNGVIKEIQLEIFVPKGMQTRIEAKYGLVEIKDFNAPLVVDAKYGGVDATISSANTGELFARTQYGEIYSNLDMKLAADWDGSIQKNKWTEVGAKIGTGPKYSLESKYGKVYLRK
jgi:hypothetical protein